MSWALQTPAAPVTCDAEWEAPGGSTAYVNVGCGPAPGANITGVAFASFGTPTGSCATGWSRGACDASTSVAVVEAACVGRPSCSVAVTDADFGDPCTGVKKELAVTVTCAAPPEPPAPLLALNATIPVGATALVALPLVAGSAAGNSTVSEGGVVVWTNGSFVPGAAAGVMDGGALPGPLDGGRSPVPALGFRVTGGGHFAFVVTPTQ